MSTTRRGFFGMAIGAIAAAVMPAPALSTPPPLGMDRRTAEVIVRGWWGTCGRVGIIENVRCGDEFYTRHDIGWVDGNRSYTWSGDSWLDAFKTYRNLGYPAEVGIVPEPNPRASSDYAEYARVFDWTLEPGQSGIVQVPR